MSRRRRPAQRQRDRGPRRWSHRGPRLGSGRDRVACRADGRARSPHRRGAWGRPSTSRRCGRAHHRVWRAAPGRPARRPGPRPAGRCPRCGGRGLAALPGRSRPLAGWVGGGAARAPWGRLLVAWWRWVLAGPARSPMWPVRWTARLVVAGGGVQQLPGDGQRAQRRKDGKPDPCSAPTHPGASSTATACRWYHTVGCRRRRCPVVPVGRRRTGGERWTREHAERPLSRVEQETSSSKLVTCLLAG